MIDYRVDDDGIAIVTWNVPGSPVNTLNDASTDRLRGGRGQGAGRSGRQGHRRHQRQERLHRRRRHP